MERRPSDKEAGVPYLARTTNRDHRITTILRTALSPLTTSCR